MGQVRHIFAVVETWITSLDYRRKTWKRYDSKIKYRELSFYLHLKLFLQKNKDGMKIFMMDFLSGSKE